MDNRLSWGPHISSVAGRATSKLSFLRRNLKIADKGTKSAAYLSLCRPNLEYCCTAWSPHNKGDIENLEKVQRKAARFCTDDYRRRSSPTSMIKSLGWESLEARRTKYRLALTYRIVHGIVSIPLDRYYHQARRQTRTCNHSHKLIEPHTRIDYLAASFFYQSPLFWNALPAKMAEAPSLAAFKSRLAKYELPQPMLPHDKMGRRLP